ncbi:hypothetical protein [Sinomonas soli]
MSPPERPERTRPNLPWLVATLVVGGTTLWFIVVTAKDSARGGLWQSFWINVASSVLLLGVLGLIEPRLRRAFVEAATRKFETAAEAVEERFEARVEELEQRVESAKALFESYMTAEDETVAAAASRPDFYTLADALVAANKAHAIDLLHGVTVPASEGIPKVVIGFHYVTPVRTKGRDFLRVAPVILEDPPPSGFWAPMEYVWQPGAPPEEFGAYLMKQLQNGGLKDVTSKVDWPGTIDRLTDALALAFESRRADGKLAGHLIEKGPGDWAVTSAGIEHIGHGIIADAKAIPPLATASMRRRGEDSHELWMDLEGPDWATPGEWEHMVGRARILLPGANTPMLMEPTHFASVKEPERPGPTAGSFDFSSNRKPQPNVH